MMSSEDIKDLTNEELATVLRNSGARVGPITDTTRLVYERKLVRIQQGIPPATAPAEEEDDEEEDEEEEEETTLPGSVYEEKPSARLTSTYQRFTSPLISKISGGNNAPPSYIGTPGSSRMNTSLTRKPLSSMREEVQFTSLRNSQATSASAASAPKKKMSIMIKLFIMIVFGLIAWLIYINFESPAAKPLLTTNH